jgi:hypothetical protein
MTGRHLSGEYTVGTSVVVSNVDSGPVLTPKAKPASEPEFGCNMNYMGEHIAYLRTYVAEIIRKHPIWI